MKEIWFVRKLYGWGWTPKTWQAWAIMAGFLFLFLLFTLNVDKTSPTREVDFNFNLPALLLTVVYILIAYQKGEKPKWQWGERIED